jgi:hypothetical protein
LENKKNKFSWKAFISIGLFYSFIIILITGLVLYIAPAGRVANWVNWKLFGITKANWQAIHTIFSFTFATLSVFHLFLINWRAFWTYLKSKSIQGLNKKKEFYLSSLLTIIFLAGVMFSVPPFSSFLDMGAKLKSSWEKEESVPPIPHAELLTLNELAVKLDSMSIEKIVNKLEANKIKFDNANQTLAEISVVNNLTPLEIYQIIVKKSSTGKVGSGMGKKSLDQLAKENNLDINEVIKILSGKNIKARKDQTLKDIAAENDMAAKDIYEIILPKR